MTLTAPLVPKWLPPTPEFWAYATGVWPDRGSRCDPDGRAKWLLDRDIGHWSDDELHTEDFHSAAEAGELVIRFEDSQAAAVGRDPFSPQKIAGVRSPSGLRSRVPTRQGRGPQRDWRRHDE